MQEWIKQEITAGLEKSFNFGFLGEPKNFAITADLWFETLESTCKNWTPERDCGRILTAFDEYFKIGKRFPLPANIIELLPTSTPQMALPRPEITDEERMTARKYLALFSFQCQNESFRKAYGFALRNKLEHETAFTVARRVFDANQDLKDAAITFFKNYKEDLIKRID